METLLSLESLLKENETLDDFFRNVRNGDSSASGRWNRFLTDLADAVNLSLIHI